jgi:hypothetical protein
LYLLQILLFIYPLRPALLPAAGAPSGRSAKVFLAKEVFGCDYIILSLDLICSEQIFVGFVEFLLAWLGTSLWGGAHGATQSKIVIGGIVETILYLFQEFSIVLAREVGVATFVREVGQI